MENWPLENLFTFPVITRIPRKLISLIFPTLAADSGFFQLEARNHRAFQNFKIYVGVATTFVSGKCSFLLKAEGASTRLRVSKLNTADIRSNKPAS